MAGWVCLMYHDVLEGGAAPGGGAEYFAVSIDGFKRQLDYIKSQGRQGCSLESWLAAPSPERVPITFDDGTASQYQHAFPALAERGMSATFFAVTQWTGRPGFATWDQLREMRRAGMSIQSHTRTHPFLSEQGPDALRSELSGSAEELGRELEVRPTTLALPGGDAPRRRFRPMIGEAGYRVVATSHWGVNAEHDNSPVRYVRRCTIRGETPLSRFHAILSGDAALGLRQGLRESVLGWTRSALGASRYARWRRSALEVLRRDR
jgi:peptidoglycan/xylan/chitin deacetylase (PgdA/CDA1 family)